jgi:uncharacterized protein
METTRRCIFDAHSHAFPDFLAPDAVRSLVAAAKACEVHSYHDGTAAGLLAAMDSAGVTKTLLYSVATRPSQVVKITDWSASVQASHTDRIHAFASVHPDFEAPEREIERIASFGLRGLKFHPQYMNCPPDDPRTVRIARAAASSGLAIAMHAGHDPAFEPTDIASPTRIRRLHDQVPNLRLLACHLGAWRQWTEALEMIIGQDIYIDTSYSLGQCPPKLLATMLERHPPTHLLFGTDSPWGNPTAEIGLFDALGMSETNKRLALWDNAHAFAGVALPA